MGLRDKVSALRDKLNQKPAITTAITGAIIVAAIVFIIISMRGGDAGGGGGGERKIFFSSDERTWFADSAVKVPGFPDPKNSNKPAYRAYVYKCPDGKTAISHLEGYNDQVRKQVEDAVAANPQAAGRIMADFAPSLIVKRPGGRWVANGPTTEQEFLRTYQPTIRDCPGATLTAASAQ